MEPQILLAQLRALLERAPDLEKFNSESKDHMIWLGQAHALVSRWNNAEAIAFKQASDLLSTPFLQESYIVKVFGILYRAVADLELQVPSDAEVCFDAGEVYKFFKALNKVIDSAEKSLFIIDPYLDDTVFDHYLKSRRSEVTVRLLLNNKAVSIMPAAQKYRDQYGDILQIKESKLLHDRIIFVDGYVCWLIGQSVKDAAKAKPTYLVQLPPDIVPGKLQNYEDICSNANTL